MAIRTFVATATMFAGTAIGLAAPAIADDFSGTYNYFAPPTNFAAGFTTTWTVTPCGPGCAHVASASGITNADAHLIDGNWVLAYDRQDAFYCGDGSTSPGTVVDTIDADTLQGQAEPQPGPACGQAYMVAQPATFTLTKTG